MVSGDDCIEGTLEVGDVGRDNGLGERQIASPAVSNGQIFIRTDDHVFAVGKPAA